MGHYIVGDIHGCFDEWMQLKERIEENDSDARFILIGDIVDRGPKVYEMLQWAMQNISDDGKYQMIMGNHEFQKIEWLKEYFKRKQKNQNYKLEKFTSDRYNFKKVLVKQKLSDAELLEIKNWMQSLPYYKQIDLKKGNKKQRYVMVHAYFPRECRNKEEGFDASTIQKEDRISRKNQLIDLILSDIIWERNYSGNEELKNTIVIHGHTPTVLEETLEIGYKKGKIGYLPKDINIDCGCVYRAYCPESNLAAIRLEDEKEFYSRED